MSATPEQIKAIFDESRNGCNSYTRHPLARKLIYTDGVTEIAVAAGAFWLLDVIGTEATPKLLKDFTDNDATLGIIEIKVANKAAAIEMTVNDDEPPIWKREIEYTDFPDGGWKLFLGVDGTLVPNSLVTVLHLPSEY